MRACVSACTFPTPPHNVTNNKHTNISADHHADHNYEPNDNDDSITYTELDKAMCFASRRWLDLEHRAVRVSPHHLETSTAGRICV